MNAPQPWHDGERALQQRSGVAERMAQAGPRVMRDEMPQQHRDFFAELPLLVAGTVDAQGHPRVTLFAGPPGFAVAPDARRLRLHPAWAEGAADALQVGAPIGLLGLQAHTGRRNRLNGRITRSDREGFEVTAGQSFGNCPKYIRPRRAEFVPAQGEAAVSELHALDDEARRIVHAADTFFIATAHPLARTGGDASQGVDVSHRGGPPGFVEVVGDTLEVPDYVGNSFFNTFGNLLLEPRCSLLFVDVASGDRLRLAGVGVVRWREGARTLLLQVTGASLARGGMPIRWSEA